MKLISPYKDYYDFLQGIYGIDEKIVYERICYASINSKGEWLKTGLYKPYYLSAGSKYESALLAICGTLYRVYIINREFYFGLNFQDLQEGKYLNIKRLLSQEDWQRFTGDLASNRKPYDYSKDELHLTPTDFNENNDCPVLLLGRRGRDHEVEAKNVRLSDFGFNQIMLPHDIYITISNFLSREKPIIDTRTDVQKIVGAGFDKKTSFRNVK